MTIHLAYACDKNYLFPVTVSAASAVFYLKEEDSLILHLLELGLSDEDYDAFCQKVRRANRTARVSFVRHHLTDEMFHGFTPWKNSLVTYARILAANLLPDVDFLIYIDGDTLWLGDPGELWKHRNDTPVFLGSVDYPAAENQIGPQTIWYAQRGLEVDASTSICAGVLLLNLKKMREHNVYQACLDFVAQYPNPPLADQTVLNYVCRTQIGVLPKAWGVFSFWHEGVDLKRPCLIHYVQDLPWKRDKPNRFFSDVVLLWFDFCKYVLGCDELKKQSLWSHIWRRGAFLFFKHNQWILRLHPYLKPRLRNTHGIPRRVYNQITSQWRSHSRELKNQGF